MGRVFLSAAVVAAAIVVLVPATSSGSSSVACTPVTTSKGAMTAAQVGGKVTGTLDATGCQIGVYYDASHPGKVSGASISGASQYGVFVDGRTGDVSVNTLDSTITNIGNVAVYYDGDETPGAVSGTVSGNTISDYYKTGVVVNGAKATARVAGNSLTGFGPVSYIAQNGIQIGWGATGQVQGNKVVGHWYTGANWTSTGILVFQSDNVRVDGNTVSDNQTGLDAETWCYFGFPSASNNKFINNSVSGSDWGAIVAAYSLYSSCDAQANNNKVTNNDLHGTNNPGSEGVFVGAYVYTPGFTPQAVNNKVINNNISGFETALDTGLGSATKVHANAVS